MTILRMSSGRYVNLETLNHDDIDVYDISNSLNQLKRFVGHYKDKEPLTVAQHTFLVMDIARIIYPKDDEVLYDCLLHDFGEAYTGDIPTPVKTVLGENIKPFLKYVDEVIYGKLWRCPTLPRVTPEIKEKTKLCDLLALDIERRVIWSDQSGKENWPELPVPRMEWQWTLRQKNDMFRRVARHPYINLAKTYMQMTYPNKRFRT